MPKPQQTPAQPVDRVTRILGTMAGTVLLLTVVSIAAIFVLRGIGTPESSFKSGFLQFIAVFPLPGIAISLLSLVALFTVIAIRRARSQRA